MPRSKLRECGEFGLVCSYYDQASTAVEDFFYRRNESYYKFRPLNTLTLGILGLGDIGREGALFLDIYFL